MSMLLALLVVWMLAMPLGFLALIMLGPSYLRRRLSAALPPERATVVDLAAARVRITSARSIGAPSADRATGA